MYCISDAVLLQLREAYVFLMDKDGRCEILFPIQFGKTVIDIAMEWGGGPEEVAGSAKMVAYLDWVFKEG